MEPGEDRDKAGGKWDGGGGGGGERPEESEE